MNDQEQRQTTDNNLVQVGTILNNELKNGLGPYILQEFALHFGSGTKKHLKSIKTALGSEKPYKSFTLDSDSAAIDQIPVDGWLKIMDRRWETIFSKKLGKGSNTLDRNVLNAHGYLRELINIRNAWSHPTEWQKITDFDVMRMAGTASRLLLAIGADEDAEAARARMLDLGKNLYAFAEGSAKDSSPNLNEKDIPTVDLHKAKLRQMDLRNRNLRRANLVEADLVESNLRQENLSCVKLMRAELRRADLSMAILTEARLVKADLCDAKLPNANLERADLIGAKLRNAEMDFAELQYADMTQADMDSAKLRNAKLQYSVMDGANLVGADFRGANMQGARMKGATLKWIGLLPLAQNEAVFDSTTILPDGSYWTEDTDMTKFTG